MIEGGIDEQSLAATPHCAAVLDPQRTNQVQSSFRFEHLADAARPSADARPDASAADPFTLMQAVHRQYLKGIELLREDAVPSIVAVLRRGLIKMVRVSTSGREHILSLHPSPVLIGAAEEVSGQPLSSAVVTATPSEVDEVRIRRCLSLVRTRNDALSALPRQLAWDVCTFRARAVEIRALSSLELLQKHTRAVRSAGRTCAGGTCGSHCQLLIANWAHVVGVIPDHLCRLFHQLECESLITRNRGWIVIHDLDQFR